MGDEKYRLALSRKVFHYLHQLRYFLRGEHGGGLVKDKYLIIAIEHFKYLGALLHADGDILNLCGGVDGEAVFLGEGEHLFERRLFGEEACLIRLNAEDYVIEHRKNIDELEMLMHHADAESRSVVRVLYLDGFAVFAYLAFLRLIQAEEHAHQRRLTRTVLTEQSVNLALAELQRNIVVCDYSGKFLGYAEHFDYIILLHTQYHSFSEKFAVYIFII